MYVILNRKSKSDVDLHVMNQNKLKDEIKKIFIIIYKKYINS